jgi:hypothetical protein
MTSPRPTAHWPSCVRRNQTARSARQCLPGRPDRGSLRRVGVLLDPGDVPVAHLQVHGRVQGDFQAPGSVPRSERQERQERRKRQKPRLPGRAPRPGRPGIGNRTGRSTPASRYWATRAVQAVTSPWATKASATCCGTSRAAASRSPAAVSSWRSEVPCRPSRRTAAAPPGCGTYRGTTARAAGAAAPAPSGKAAVHHAGGRHRCGTAPGLGGGGPDDRGGPPGLRGDIRLRITPSPIRPASASIRGPSAAR